mmetsp:Transcript_89696/g.161803  ORF Transcript_89696/g.161803 Transcript_89696/m.161803 type:complete len:166 (-) Transcript_89696:301-798(-)
MIANRTPAAVPDQLMIKARAGMTPVRFRSTFPGGTPLESEWNELKLAKVPVVFAVFRECGNKGSERVPWALIKLLPPQLEVVAPRASCLLAEDGAATGLAPLKPAEEPKAEDGTLTRAPEPEESAPEEETLKSSPACDGGNSKDAFRLSTDPPPLEPLDLLVPSE